MYFYITLLLSTFFQRLALFFGTSLFIRFTKKLGHPYILLGNFIVSFFICYSFLRSTSGFHGCALLFWNLGKCFNNFRSNLELPSYSPWLVVRKVRNHFYSLCRMKNLSPKSRSNLMSSAYEIFLNLKFPAKHSQRKYSFLML